MRSPSTNTLRQIVYDRSGSRIGSVCYRFAIQQACTEAGAADGEGFALLVRGGFALDVA
jgi:hypothetical protein